MTRVRVLQRAIRLLNTGFMPYDSLGQARDKDGNIVAYVHPDAVRFNVTGAVVRAVYELTGDLAADRNELWDAAMLPFRQQHKSWSAMYDAFRAMSKEEAISTLQTQLDKWNNM